MHNFLKLFAALIFAALILAVVPSSSSGFAQQETEEASASLDDVAQLRSELQLATDLDEATRAGIESDLAESEKEISRAAELEKLATAFEALPDPAEQRKVLEKQVVAHKQAESVVPSAPTNNEALGTEIKAIKDRVDLLKKQTTEAENEANRRAGRREVIRPRLLKIEPEIAEVVAQLAKLPVSSPLLAVRAKRLRLSSQKLKLELESSSLKNELTRYDLEEGERIVQLELELYRNQLARQTGLLAKLEETRREREKKAAAEASTEAKKQQAEMERRNPLLSQSYEINTELAEQNETFVKRSATIAEELKRVRDQLDNIEDQFAETEVMVDQVGLSGSVGNLLRQRKSDLPNSQSNSNKAREIKREVESVQFQLFDVNRRQSELTRETIEAEIMANELALPSSLDSLDQQVDSLLTARQEILVALKRNVRNLFDTLVDMEFRYRTLASVSQTYRQYLNERIFWIKSNKFLFTEMKIDESDKRLIEPARWKKTGNDFVDLIQLNFLFLGMWLIGEISLIALRPRLRTEISNMGQLASKGSCASFWPTLRAMFATLLLAIATPLPLLLLGAVIQQSSLNDGRSLLSALGGALFAAGLFAFPVEFLRHTCRANGLAEKHFLWSNDGITILKRNLGWLTPLGTCIVFGLVLLQRLDSSHRVDMTERILFVVGMFCLFVFLRRIMSPKAGVFREYLQEHKNSWVYQTSTLWFIAITGLPILMAVLAVWGYYYTTLSLILCAFSTFVFAIVVEMLRALLKRFILIRRRHAHIESAKRKREADRELRKQQLQARALAAGEDGVGSVLPETLHEMDAMIDIDENAVEATRLIGLGTFIIWVFGLWIIWADVLPALKALDQQPVFPGRLLVDQSTVSRSGGSGASNGESTANGSSASNGESGQDNGGGADNPALPMAGVPAAESGSSTTSENQLAKVTYGDLLLFLFIAAITIAAARSLPGTLEMIFLNQLPLDRSVRYATKSLFSYGIILLGTVLAFRALSISWSNVQWLATALTFGLAFGLQEIFANFVAGIILMFERPMRIGDWITIDDFTGMVTKIRTRATTIVNFDRKEYVIPNKDFITGRLVNWTLSDAINRVEIKIGVAYGSDVEKARKILYELCEHHPKIVSDPPAFVTFQEFGDSSLNLVLRAFLRDIESRVPTIDELHTQINRAFIEAGIEISFPQRDLHIRSIDPTLEAIWEGRSKPADPAGKTDPAT